MTTRNDSFKGLVHKLEGEGKSAHYAQAIAGKVAKEKGDIGKKDAQDDDKQRSELEHYVDLLHRRPESAQFKVADYRYRANRNRRVAEDPSNKKSTRGAYRRGANEMEGNAKDIEGIELDAQEKGDPWSDQNTRHDADFDTKSGGSVHISPETGHRHLGAIERAAHNLRRSAHAKGQTGADVGDGSVNDINSAHAAYRLAHDIRREHGAQRNDEEPDMANHDDLKGRIQALHDELDELESQLHGSDEPEGDEPEGDEPSEDRNGEDEHEAGEELAEGHEDVEHGDRAEGEELEHEAGEAEAEDRDHGDDDDNVREHRGDQAPEDVAESITEADAQSSRRSVGVKRSFNNRHDSNEDNDMTQRSDEDIRRRIDVLDARLKRATRSASYKERDELSRIRARCDSVAQALGVRPEAPLPGEFPDEYRRRCAALLQPFSQSTKGVSIGRLDDAAFSVVEDRIYADAQSAAREPIKSLAGRLVPVESHDAAGRTITKYYGDPKAWMRPYMAPGVHIRFADSATRRNTGAR